MADDVIRYPASSTIPWLDRGEQPKPMEEGVITEMSERSGILPLTGRSDWYGVAYSNPEKISAEDALTEPVYEQKEMLFLKNQGPDVTVGPSNGDRTPFMTGAEIDVDVAKAKAEFQSEFPGRVDTEYYYISEKAKRIGKKAAIQKYSELLRESSGDEAPTRSLSISQYLKTQQEAAMGTGPRPMYAEEINPSLVNATSDDTIARSQFSDLGGKPPRDRAKIGARFGAQQGLQTRGLVGSLIGAAVGATAGRALGVIQSGEFEDNVRKDKMLETLSTMGVVGRESTIDFGDLGRSPLITNNPSMRLANTSAYGQGADRSLYEVDQSNPFVNRATLVARPMALYLSQGLLGYKDRKSPRDENAAQNAVNLFVNTLTNDADSEQVVYGRARQLVQKFGLDEDKMRSYFDANKNMFEPEEAKAIRMGMDRIFQSGVK